MRARRPASADNTGMHSSNTPADSLLGRAAAYPDRYDPGLLFPLPRAAARADLGLDGDTLPFHGHDRWHAYELGWLDARGKPVTATATFFVPADSPNLIESKSLKLYLNSFNGERLEHPDVLRARIEGDLSRAAGAPVSMSFGLPESADADDAADIDALDVDISHYGPPDAGLLHADAGHLVEETLTSGLLKSNCPVTGQPDWATLRLTYRGPRIDRASLLRYLASFRNHCEFHEQCVERIFSEIAARCGPERLSVEARYTRRGGLDINPWRASSGMPAPPARRDPRQ